MVFEKFLQNVCVFFQISLHLGLFLEMKVFETKKTTSGNVDNAIKLISYCHIGNDQESISSPVFKLTSKKTDSSETENQFHHETVTETTTTQREFRRQKSNFEKVPPRNHPVLVSRKTKIIKPADRRRSSSALDSPIRSQSPTVSHKMTSSGVTGRSTSCTSAVPPPKKTKFAALSSSVRERRSPRVPQRVLDLSRFKRNQRKSRGL